MPAGNVPYLMGHATGTQNYTCQNTATGYAWTLVAPDARLVDDKGKQIATHYGGPTWEAKDGSKRQAVQIIANTVQFLGSRDGSGGGGGGGGNGNGGFTPPSSDVPADTSDFEGAAVGGASEDDIPF